MASLMEELIDVLSKETEEYEVLLNLSNDKTPIIVKGDIPMLEELTEMEQEITSRIRNLDNRRDQITKDIANVTNRDQKELTLSNLIELMASQPEEQEKLSHIKTGLEKVLKEMRRVNAENAVLIQQALEMVEFDLTLFRSMRQAPTTANYDKRANNTGELLGNGGFDAKQ